MEGKEPRNCEKEIPFLLRNFHRLVSHRISLFSLDFHVENTSSCRPIRAEVARRFQLKKKLQPCPPHSAAELRLLWSRPKTRLSRRLGVFDRAIILRPLFFAANIFAYVVYGYECFIELDDRLNSMKRLIPGACSLQQTPKAVEQKV